MRVSAFTSRLQWRFVLLLLPVVPAVLGTAACSAGIDDAALVECLSPQYRTQLVDAAVILGFGQHAPARDELSVGGSRLTVEKWRELHEDDFNRSCTALVAAGRTGSAQGGGGGSNDAVVAVLATVLGAVATGLATVWPNISGQRRLRADDLRRVALEFTTAGQIYIDGWLGQGIKPTPAALRTSQQELAAQVRQIAVLHPSWRVPGQLRDELFQEPLDDALHRRWVEAASRDDHAALLRNRLAYLHDGADKVADALEHPLRHWRRMRSSAAMSGTGLS